MLVLQHRGQGMLVLKNGGIGNAIFKNMVKEWRMKQADLKKIKGKENEIGYFFRAVGKE